jgi:hypothetical protein
MIVWRGFLVLFGGFYEAMREVRRMLYYVLGTVFRDLRSI